MDNFIFELENVLPENICHEIIQKFENDERKKPGEMSRGVDKSVKDSTDLYISRMEDWHPYCNIITNGITKGLIAY